MPATGPLSVLRAFRILRVLRLVSTVPAMRRVVTGLLEQRPGLFAETVAPRVDCAARHVQGLGDLLGLQLLNVQQVE